MVLLLVVAPAWAQDLSREEELGELRLQIDRLQTRLARLGHERRSLAAELARINIELELQQVRVEEAGAQGQLAAEELFVLESRVQRLEEQLERTRGELRSVLARLYRVGGQGFLRLFLSLDSGDELLSGSRQLRFLAQRDSKVVRSYVETYETLSIRREEARSKSLEIQRWLVQEANRRDELERLSARQTLVLARLEVEHQQVTARASQLLVRERKLRELIGLLTGQLRSMPEGTPIHRFRGVLDWPVTGRISRGFGPRLDPRYGTQVPHNGLELSTGGPVNVRVIYSGQVLYAAPLDGYGLTAIVLHPGRIFSLYAGLDGLGVAQGDVLSLGQVVGTIDGQLYFEIRVENRPEDPTRWLR
ncbi:MAG: peptidoglycan DD-metalloendopeptidase family protein [Deltaproteobacteria bacterium]|nr:peptidoglycan DD-metalloendopeptidase family protein [Deltaproteobacteria bacterium]